MRACVCTYINTHLASYHNSNNNITTTHIYITYRSFQELKTKTKIISISIDGHGDQETIHDGDYDTTHICVHVSDLQSCIRWRNEHFRLRFLSSSVRYHVLGSSRFLLRAVHNCILLYVHWLIDEYVS